MKTGAGWQQEGPCPTSANTKQKTKHIGQATTDVQARLRDLQDLMIYVRLQCSRRSEGRCVVSFAALVACLDSTQPFFASGNIRHGAYDLSYHKENLKPLPLVAASQAVPVAVCLALHIFSNLKSCSIDGDLLGLKLICRKLPQALFRAAHVKPIYFVGRIR